MKNASILLLFAVLPLLFFACGENQSDKSDGDMETVPGDQEENPADGDIDSDSGTSEADGTSEDGDMEAVEQLENEVVEVDIESDPVEDEKTSESDTDNADGDEAIDSDAEYETEQDETEALFRITVDSLPFQSTTVVPCENITKDFVAGSIPQNLWGDGLGKIFFAGLFFEDEALKTYLAQYDESSDTLTCLNIFDDDTTPALSGRLLDGEPEVWVFTGSMIGRYYSGAFEELVEVPDAPELSFLPPAMEVSAGGIVSLYANWGWYFFDTASGVLSAMEPCPGMENNKLLYGYWVGEVFYIPGGCTVYAVDPEQMNCEAAFTIEECCASEKGWLYAYGVTGEELWLAQIHDIEIPALEWQPRFFYRYDLSDSTYQVVQKDGFISSCYPSCGSGASYLQALPGMAGWPFILARASQGWNFYDVYVFSFAVSAFLSDGTFFTSPAYSTNGWQSSTGQPLLRSKSWRHGNQMWVLSFKTFRYTWTETEQ